MLGFIPKNKVCSQCGNRKLASEFYRRKRRNGGIYLYHACKSCWSIINTANSRRWRRRYPEYVRAKNAERRATNGEYYKQWYRENRWRYQAYNEKRRAAPGDYTPLDVLFIYESQAGRCAYCQCGLGQSFHIDHKIPLSRGGTNSKENLCCACFSCNRRKHAKTAEEFAWERRESTPMAYSHSRTL